MKKWFLSVVPAVLFCTPVFAADDKFCIQEIRRVCAGLEDSLEDCLSRKELSTECRDQLNGAMSMAKTGRGPGTCLPDIKRFCGELNEAALTGCIADQKSNFTKPCQDFLDQSAGASTVAPGVAGK